MKIILMIACLVASTSCRSLAPGTTAAPTTGTVGIGVMLHTTGPRLGPELRPEVAVLATGQRAEWFSVDGELRIEPLSTIPSAECQKRRKGHLCWIQIPKGHAAGRYRYRALVRIDDGTEYPVDGLLDIRN